MEEQCSSVTKRKQCEDCYSLFEDKLSSFCSARLKLDPLGKRERGGTDKRLRERLRT